MNATFATIELFIFFFFQGSLLLIVWPLCDGAKGIDRSLIDFLGILGGSSVELKKNWE